MRNWFARKEIEVTDEMLSKQSQVAVQDLVKRLDDETVSLAWRSQLNLKLLEAQDKKKKQVKSQRLYTWGSTVGVGAAAVFAGFLMMSTPQSLGTSLQAKSLSSLDLEKVHQETIAFASVSGTGASEIESTLTPVIDQFDSSEDLL